MQGDVTVSLGNGASFTHPSLMADEIFSGSWGEAGQDVTVPGVPTGTLTLYAVNTLDEGKLVTIGTQVVV